MDSLAAIAWTSFLVGFSGAMMPGPMLTVNITEGIKRGFWAGPLLVVGHGTAELLLLVALSLGLGAVVQIGWVSATIAVVGGCVLLWMAFDMLRGVWQRTLSLRTTGSEADMRMGPVLAGGVVSVSNPLWILWWATIGLTYVAWASSAGRLGLVAFFGGHILADLGWFSVVSLVVTGGRRWLSDRVYRGLIAVLGLFLVGLSVYFVLTGIQQWL
jgi:threonine/homoserine/homoserine lactone efflux protein